MIMHTFEASKIDIQNYKFHIIKKYNKHTNAYYINNFETKLLHRVKYLLKNYNDIKITDVGGRIVNNKISEITIEIKIVYETNNSDRLKNTVLKKLNALNSDYILTHYIYNTCHICTIINNNGVKI